ncbi:hypothetical protein, partial [Escherichia coli]|uniref:hypothetical protein n=1 Tax=Escherichia coli TaxID=562 RepID=UPI001F41CDB6
VTLKMPAFEWVHVQLHQQKGMISLSPPTICNSAKPRYAQIMVGRDGEASACWFHNRQSANPVTSCHLFSSG